MKKIIILTIVFILISIKSIYGFSIGELKGANKNFISLGQNQTLISEEEAANALLPIGKILVAIAGVVLVVVGLILSVQYIMAGVNEKAKIKEKILWYVISIVLVFGAVGIFTIANTIIKDLIN